MNTKRKAASIREHYNCPSCNKQMLIYTARIGFYSVFMCHKCGYEEKIFNPLWA